MSSEHAVQGGRHLRIGKYVVVGHLASGSMSAVYKARDTLTDELVALKVLPLEKAGQPELLERFQREARIGARLEHENIVRHLDAGEENGIHFLALEYVAGINLLEHIHRAGRLSEAEAQALVIQAARALAHLHERGIVHRDIKPANFVLVDADPGFIKLIDLGLARDVHEPGPNAWPSGTVGTPDYVAPEQARNAHEADGRSDLYALGGTWYHTLAGQPPFPEGTVADKVRCQLEVEPPDIRDLNPAVSRSTATILQRLLMKEPAFRYQSPAELLHALEPIEQRRPRVPRLMLIAATAALAAGLAVALWALNHK